MMNHVFSSAYMVCVKCSFVFQMEFSSDDTDLPNKNLLIRNNYFCPKCSCTRAFPFWKGVSGINGPMYNLIEKLRSIDDNIKLAHFEHCGFSLVGDAEISRLVISELVKKFVEDEFPGISINGGLDKHDGEVLTVAFKGNGNDYYKAMIEKMSEYLDIISKEMEEE